VIEFRVELVDLYVFGVFKAVVEVVYAKLGSPFDKVCPHDLCFDEVELSCSQEASARAYRRESERGSYHQAWLPPIFEGLDIQQVGIIELVRIVQTLSCELSLELPELVLLAWVEVSWMARERVLRRQTRWDHH
jgi:hypothetical protein